MDVQGKVWGETSLIFLTSTVEVHRIVGIKGGYSSKHHHQAKHNMFFVESGELLVRIWNDNGMVDETRVGYGQTVSVPPGVWHQFEVLEDNTVAFEFYHTEIDPTDIQREGVGGLRSSLKNEGV